MQNHVSEFYIKTKFGLKRFLCNFLIHVKILLWIVSKIRF